TPALLQDNNRTRILSVGQKLFDVLAARYAPATVRGRHDLDGDGELPGAGRRLHHLRVARRHRRLQLGLRWPGETSRPASRRTTSASTRSRGDAGADDNGGNATRPMA